LEFDGSLFVILRFMGTSIVRYCGPARCGGVVPLDKHSVGRLENGQT
jgi:hypothetical protein